MVKIKKQTKAQNYFMLSRAHKICAPILIILILSLVLSFVPNFLYSEGEEDPCQGFDCPEGCSKQYDAKTGNCVCINCDIYCHFADEEFKNKSCSPLTGTGEWTCGIEIPVGEVIDRSFTLASKMLAEFGGEIENGKEMILWTERILKDYQSWSCEGYTNWEDEDIKCRTDCYKSYNITAGVLQSGQIYEQICKDELGETINRGKSVYPEECNEDYTQCLSCNSYCSQEEHKEECCWFEPATVEIPDPENPAEIIEKTASCKYCKKDDEGEIKYCSENCSPWTCWGYCQQYFSPIINGYTNIVNLQDALKNDIEETNTPEKFKRSYILEQLDFSRCQLAQCFIRAEDYYDVLEGKKIGKHLLTCEAATQSGLLDDDQLSCYTSQIITELEEIKEMWGELETAPWWQKPLVAIKLFFKTQWMIIQIVGKFLWELITEWTDAGQEEGCYPTNYYCCQM